jgi:5-formyltetrahydrofolate cyclo-ligase
MIDSSPTVSASKWNLRSAALAARDALSEAHRLAGAETIAQRGLPVALAPGAVVAGYSSIRSELDPLPLMRALAAQGASLALPVTIASDLPLEFRAWSPGDPTRRGPLGIPEPFLQGDDLVPDVVLVPLAAFDRRGHRIGYGAGNYDRTLAHLRALKSVSAIGLAFTVQEIEAIPALSHDATLDYVLTEINVFDFRSL